MPNHVTTRCTVTGPVADIARFREQVFSIENEETDLDFEKIIPQPPILSQVDESTTSKEAAVLILARADVQLPVSLLYLPEVLIKRIREDMNMPNALVGAVATAYFAKYPESEAQGRLRLQAILETGYGSWYPWRIDNCGTKWNSYQYHLVSEEPFEFVFDTASHFPKPIFVKLAENFPTLHFRCVTFNEGGSGQGYFNPPEGEAEWELCAATDALFEQVHGWRPDHEQADD